MKIIMLYTLLFLNFFGLFSQENGTTKKWLRTGFIYGFASQNTFISQDSDYRYEHKIFKFSNHFSLSTKENHSWEIAFEPSYYSSKHQSYNVWHKYFTSSANIAEELQKFVPLKTINEYVLNFGIVYRRTITDKLSVYALGNIGPMYIDTDTERLKKGFAFSDIFGLGINYNYNKWSIDAKTMIRHVSNANLQYPNFGYNAVGFEFGTYYELN